MLTLAMVISMFAVPMAPVQAATTIIYVDASAGGANDGTSWGDAYTSLQAALADPAIPPAVGDDVQIWVAAGTYSPGSNRSDTFELVNNVEIYGGFDGTETLLSERNPDPSTNNTILSGDVNGDDGPSFANRGDNNYNVVEAPTSTDATAILDGFTITGGNADVATFPHNNGGGIHNRGTSSATFANLLISGNQASNIGGGVNNDNSGATFTNVTISGNQADDGGGVSNTSFTFAPTFVNVTISGNRANAGGGGVRDISFTPHASFTNVTIAGNRAVTGGGFELGNGTPTIQNSIIAGNDATTGPQVNVVSGTPSYDNSLVEGETLGGTNLDGTTATADFVAPEAPANAPTTAGDYRLQDTSDAIDAGDNAANTTATDLNGFARIIDGDGDSTATIDLGGYEYRPPQTFYVDAGASGANDGSSWADAYTDLQVALNNVGSGDEIWVTAGTYTPSSANGFQLVNGVGVYGGFSPGDTQLSDRDPDPATNGTVLSGADNYRVVTGSGTDDTAVLDGFTISDGNADSSTPADRGGGIYNDGGSPTLQNLIIEDNTANFGGGGMFNDNGSNPIVTNVIFQSNLSGNGGGMFNDNGSNPTLTNVLIRGNTASYGAGINNRNSSPILTNVAISGGSGLGGVGMYNSNNSNPVLTNTTIVGNRATTYGGGGMDNASGSTPLLTNTVIWGNDAPSNPQVDSDPTFNYSLIQGQNPGGTNLDGTTITDPGFTDPVNAADASTTDGDLSLLATSPLIDAGDNAANSEATDLAGNDRIIDGDGDSTATIDIGAYEAPDTTAPNPPVVTGGPTIETDDPTPTFSGTAEAGSTVTVVIDLGGGESVTYETTADGNGDWSIDLENDTPTDGTLPDGGLGTGNYPVSVTATDAADNESDPTALTLTITDSDAPNPPVISGGSPIETDDPTPAISGTAEPGSTVTVVIDLGGGESVTYETTADGNGDWSIDLENDTPTDGTLPDGGLGTGNYPVSITATDAADNASTPTALTLTITTGSADVTTLYIPFVAR